MSYRVKRPGSFPEGDLYLDSNGMGNGYMGKAAVKNVSLCLGGMSEMLVLIE